ncbi:septal ring lytic transglycosylase RlpA family protein [Motilimonas pumila]|uniref:Endolytic peptidoglycan transglycosylase RlpA n=1 Tax=Motilimonas pumila TaxID=2303987 RepID=A0A418YJS6_9GAMM|nr:septal ring lytic transglycosylase RlpA family protein [Motilimonas pumila]RJG51237.1 septal ring lytic transglycosylase RlpA family protein [Motilimonas pumila]
MLKAISYPIAAVLIAASLLTACSQNATDSSATDNKADTSTVPSSSRYSISQDHAPTQIPDLSTVEEPEPRYEPYSAKGNKSYTVRGQRYHVWKDKAAYKEVGHASWYGNKFHGHLTSNGERYDMYSMSAAHKNLPLPSYVKVTNLANQKSVIVRVNDRGPFHGGRIIDLSYAAADKIGMVHSGTAKVEVELINPNYNKANPQQALLPANEYLIQVVAGSNKAKLETLAKQLEQTYQVPTVIVADKAIYRLRIGPLTDQPKTFQLFNQLKAGAYPSAFVITQAITPQS